VKPGLHAAREGGGPVVWWDPRALSLDREEEVGLRQQQILAADAASSNAAEGEEAHARWQGARSEALLRGGEPSLRVAAVTSLAVALPEPGEEVPEVRVEEVATARGGRPGGLRFGSLVHAVLASVEPGDAAPEVRATAEGQGRLLGATDDEIGAAADAALAALAHPLLRRAAVAHEHGGLRRETPVALRLPDGSLAEGVVDLAFREPADAARGEAEWTVVDFKTDRELETRRVEYARQVALYAEAVTRATGEPARPVLLVV
jgi:ATP-dependent helicase/nuclease subunit A